MKGLDTDVLVRHLTQDDPRQSPLATRAIAACSREEPGFINRVVLCELVWVLEGAYGYSRPQIASALDRIVRTAQFRIEDLQAVWSALRAYRDGKADFADCLVGETNRRAGCAETLTFDAEAARLATFRLLAP